MAMSFLNPYLKGFKSEAKKASDVKSKAYMRLIHKCFKPDEQNKNGVLSIETNVPPTGFYQNREFLVFPEGKRSFFERPASTAGREPDTVTFHAYDIMETVYHTDRCDEVPCHLQTDIIPSGVVLKLFGRDTQERSVCVNVFGQKVYFYVHCPDSSNLHRDVQHLLQDSGHRSTSFSITKVNKKFLTGYSTESNEVYQITMSSSSAMAALSSKLQQQGYTIFEANVDAIARFVIDNKFSTFGWFSCRNVSQRAESLRDSHTSLEYDCHVRDVKFNPDMHSWPRYNIMAFDIECLGESGFPSPARDEDTIIQISCVIWPVGGEDFERECILLTVGTCDDIPGTLVYTFPSELDMLHAFFAILRDRDIEFVTGYNISNFDFQYVLDRASGIYNIRPENYTRTKSGTIFAVHKPREGNFMRSNTKVKLAGVVVIDMYLVCREKMSLSNYKLNTVAKHCVGEKKEDVSYKEIPLLFKGTARDRARLGLYCVQDSILVIDLLKHFMTHVEISEIAKIANIPARRVITDGQQIRVFSCLLAAARDRNYILPMPVPGAADGYQGATVINPTSGFYDTPVLVVDFASLYPSIIQAYNLCYSTMIEHGRLHQFPWLKKEDYQTFVISSGPVHFVKRHKTESLLSNLLTAWLAKRRAIRKELATCQDEKLKTILDKQQLAIKVTCNAVYGFTGVASGLLPCLKIAETVTLQGRTMLEKTKQYVESLSHADLEKICNFPVTVASGCDSPQFQVIYGDTDSLFINCVGYDIDTALAFGDRLAEHTSERLFDRPIKLEAEKVFRCLLMLTKKRYIGILSNEKILMKGVDLVRKTACAYVQTVARDVLDLVLKDGDVRASAQLLSQRSVEESYRSGLPLGFLKVIDVLNAAHQKLALGQVPIAQLTYSTELSREFAYYKSHNLPHLAVYKKMMSRNEELPQVHDRIAYVFTESTGSLVSDMAEDPNFAEQNNIPIAAEWYFHKVVHSVANILQCLFKNNVDATVALLYNFLRANAS